ncbi:MAG: lytic transglycosylase domain-containing protein [Bdellovibrionales bacterium]|nr:lytic transglycosylase domain-containing protein [Bdellovibrionales bacterium]
MSISRYNNTVSKISGVFTSGALVLPPYYTSHRRIHRRILEAQPMASTAAVAHTPAGDFLLNSRGRKEVLRRRKNFGKRTKRYAPKFFRSKIHPRVVTFFLILFATAAAVGVGTLIFGTSFQHEYTQSELSTPFARKIAPSLLHFRTLTNAQRKEIAGRIHFLSQKVTERARSLPASSTKEMAGNIFIEASRFGADPLLVTSIVYSESAFRVNAQSSKQAYGLMQIQPATAKFTAQSLGISWRGTTALLTDQRYNLMLGIAYLQYLRDRYNGDLSLALMAYNWGPTNLDTALANRSAPPNSVRMYAKKIIDRHALYAAGYFDSKEQYHTMNASFVPAQFWQSLNTIAS